MIELILMVTLNPVNPLSSRTAQFQPCVWPNKCAVEAPVQTAQFQTCVWPNKCAKPAPAVAQFETCVWPNKCGKGA